MPAPNDQRRALLTDTAIELLAEAGVHGLTHRAVERRAGLPAGTASNYFRSREALLLATAQRIVALHHADMDAAAAHPPPPSTSTAAQTVELITASLVAAATTHRTRYRAIFELRMESLRRPALAATLTELAAGTTSFTAGHHAQLGLDIPVDTIPALMALYGGALYTLVTEPAPDVDEDAVRMLAQAIVRGATGIDPAPPSRRRRSRR